MPYKQNLNTHKYAVYLNRYRNYAPHLYCIPYLYGVSEDIDSVMSLYEMTAEQRQLMQYIKEYNAIRKQADTPPDLSVLLPMLQKANISVYLDNGYASRPIKIDMDPPKISAKIVYEPQAMYSNQEIVKHIFTLVIDNGYAPINSWSKRGVLQQTQGIGSDYLIREHGQTIQFFKLTPAIADIIARAEQIEKYVINKNGHRHVAKLYESRLTGEEIMRLPQICAEAVNVMNLTEPSPDFSVHICEHAQKAFDVNYDATAGTLQISPIVDYEADRINIADSVYTVRTPQGQELRYRGIWQHANAHVITLKGNVLFVASKDTSTEIEWHRELARIHDDIGFSKTLRCNLTDKRKSSAYIRDKWPNLLSYAREHNYPIYYSKDQILYSRQVFRADFDVDLNTDKDWLFFDVDCYCGNDKITLETLRNWINSGEAFLRRDDGTLVEIENRSELEKLVRLLENFRKQKKGYEGAIRNAPELQYIMTCSKYYNSERKKSFDAFMQDMTNGKSVKKVKLPAHLSAIMRPYQKDGVEWMYFLRKYRFAGILADDMGLGKTLQTLAILAMERIDGLPSVVICPKSLVQNWKNEATKFTPETKVAVVYGTPKERLAIIQSSDKYDLMIISYNTIRCDESMWTNAKRKFNYVILDEAQFIKNHATKSSQVVKKLNAEYRLALTGTPLENNVSEIWSMFDFLMPGFLGSYRGFADQFHKPIMDKGDMQVLEHLRQKIAYFMLRRTKTDVLTELPPKIEQTTECELGNAQNILYQEILSQVRSEIFNTVQSQGFGKSRIHILAGLTKLRQVCNHPALLGNGLEKYDSAKMDLCMELVDEVIEGKRKVLIFSQFTSMLDILANELKKRDIKHLYLSGKTKNRQELVDMFNSDESISVFLISTKAGGTGLNLTSADTVIIFDPWWNPSVENQAADRAHRIGQKKTVNVYRLITKGTIEEKIQTLQKKKQGLFDALINESGDTFKKLTWDDVRQLFES